MRRKQRDYFVIFVVWTSFIFGELFAIKIAHDAFGRHPDRVGWIIALFLGGPFVGFLLFVPILILATVIVGIFFPRDY